MNQNTFQKGTFFDIVFLEHFHFCTFCRNKKGILKFDHIF